MPGPSLLVGNGPNRVVQDVHSWGNVLARLAQEFGHGAVVKTSATKPFPLLYEELALRSARRGVSESQLKQRVGQWTRELRPNEVHASLMALPFRHVLTTNYDYALEESAACGYESADLSSESRYSLFRCQRVGRRVVWHIHGEAAKPDTIVLGHDQYVGYLNKTRQYLTRTSTRPRYNQYDYRSPVLHDCYDFETHLEPYSWIDVFLRDDIHIVGFSLDYSEIALWWLIGYKERLRLADERLPKNVRVGRTFFYYIDDGAASAEQTGRLELLHDMGVQPRRIERQGSWCHAWESLVHELRAAT